MASMWLKYRLENGEWKSGLENDTVVTPSPLKVARTGFSLGSTGL